MIDLGTGKLIRMMGMLCVEYFNPNAVGLCGLKAG